MIEKIESLSLDKTAAIAQMCIDVMEECKTLWDDTHPCSGEGAAMDLYRAVQDNADAMLTATNKMLDLQLAVGLADDPYSVKEGVKRHRQAYGEPYSRI